ncbi:type II secretion system F family protein [Bacillus sp. T3]|uniref:type II secretion system F family protein n=1 Tax=Bacillus sp. T3 TaxID=467262 RepID=UPI002981FE18|nr:type II secretion system F family protein [Bacillus sp. T3]
MNKWIILFFVFYVSVSMFFLVFKRVQRIKAVDRRLSDLAPENQSFNPNPKFNTKNNLMRLFLSYTGKFLKGITFSKSTEKLLSEAGTMLKPEEYLVLRMVIALGAGLVSWMLDLNAFIVIALCVLGFIYPHFYMKRKRKKRLNTISYQLIETLGTMANSLRAGFSFMQAMQLAGKEIPEPLGPELDRAVTEAGLGVPMEEVLESMMKRLPNKELEVVIRAILAQRRSGGNLAELMETMEETIRGRIRVLEELRTLTAQGRMSSWIITVIPICLGLYLHYFGDGYFTPMLEHPLGWIMLSSATISVVIGWIFLRKIVKIEV